MDKAFFIIQRWNSLSFQQLLRAVLPVSHPMEKSPRSWSLSWYIRIKEIQNNKHYAGLLWEPLSGFLIQLWDAQCERGFYCRVLKGRCGRKGKLFWRQDMFLYCISFLEPWDGNICLLTPTLTHKRTIGLLHPCTLRKWILSVRIRGFPGGEVHGGDRGFGKSGNADAGCCRAGQGYSSSPKELVCLYVLYMRACMCLHVHIWCMQFFMYAWTSVLLSCCCCPASLGPKACWLQQHVNILQRGLSSQLSSLIYCYSQQLSQPICRDKIFEPQRMRKNCI